MSKGQKYEQKFDKLREKFNMASEAVEEMDDDLEGLEIAEVADPGQHLPEVPTTEDPNVFTISALKEDFGMVRRNVISVINSGQHILEQVSILDVGDMKASQLMALATLQKTLGENVKLLMEIYKDIVSIEKDKHIIASNNGFEGGQQMPGAMNVKGNVHQQIVVAGNTRDLLNAISDMKEIPAEVVTDGTA